MMLRIAWRNIMRNKRRSMIVLVSIIVGLVGIILDESVATGMADQMLENQIGAHVTHVQVHKKGFRNNMLVDRLLPDKARVRSIIDTMRGIVAAGERVVAFGLAGSAENSSGAMIIGIGNEEHRLTNIAASVVEGRYLSGRTGEVLIGRKLADKLNAELGDKIVLMASTRDGAVANAMFRITGLYTSFSSDFEKTYLYVPLGDAQQMLGLGSEVHEIALRAANPGDAETVAASLRAALGEEVEALSYNDLLPLLVSQIELYRSMMYIIYIIFGAAMIFGIINTMLMSVFERIREFGVLLATGMGTGTLFRLVLLEALLLGIIGTVLGMAAGLAFYARLAVTGLDLSMFAAGMTAMGIGTVITPQLDMGTIARQALIVPVLCMLAAVYPAWKAIRLQPVQAIAHV